MARATAITVKELRDALAKFADDVRVEVYQDGWDKPRPAIAVPTSLDYDWLNRECATIEIAMTAD